VVDSVASARTLRENLSAHPAVMAWTRATGGPEPVEIRLLRDRWRDGGRWVIKDSPAVYWLRWAARDRGAVIAKLNKCSRADVEHAVYRDVLPRLPVTGLSCLGRVEENAELSWLFLEYADGARYSAQLARDQQVAGSWLGVLHASAAALSETVSLPERGITQSIDRARSARSTFRAHLGHSTTSANGRAVLEAAVSELSMLDESWDELEAGCEKQPRTLVHGDFQPRNLRLRSGPGGPQLMAFDWEEAGWGFPAIDLAGSSDASVRYLWANPCLDSYRRAAAHHGMARDPDALRRLGEIGRVLRCVTAMYWVSMEFDPAGRWAVADSKFVPDLLVYVAHLADAMAALGWHGRGSRSDAWVSNPSAVPRQRPPEPGDVAVPGHQVIRGEVDDSLSDVLATVEPGARVIAARRFNRRVHRLMLAGGKRSSLVVKQARRDGARKTALLKSRWLPAVGLEDHGPPLLATGPGPGESAWQVFEDLGDCALLPDHPEPGGLEAATQLIAQLHVAFAGHRLLPGCIEDFGDLGACFYGNWIRHAARELESIAPPSLSPARVALLDRLRRRVDALLAEEPARTRLLQDVGGPVTLLHGDLWPKNVLLPPARDGPGARLIDWDHAAVGPAVYDLSTFIYRLAPRARIPALQLYERSVRTTGWRLSGPAELNRAFETAEYARLASSLSSFAEAAGRGADWAFEDLERVDEWLVAHSAAPAAVPLR
jgi:Ser/Thr protein kinase RdoA (MazF antagonist)